VSEFGLILSGFYAPGMQKERIKKINVGVLLCRGEGLFQVAPVGPGADFHDDGHGQFVDAFHFFLN
jgi:hypothetical protein